MKFLRNGFVLLLLISLAGPLLFYTLRDDVQCRLNEQIRISLELNQRGVQLLEAGEYSYARKLFLASFALNKLNGETFAQLARAEYYMGNYQHAYEHLMSAFNMEITSVGMVDRLVVILLRSGRYAEARRFLEKGLSEFPGEPRLQGLLEAMGGTAPPWPDSER
jgi:tetratricopeptide (TPR) repeat protein